MTDREITKLEELFRAADSGTGDPLADDMGGPAGKVHDWRNHVGSLGEIWASLPREARMAAFLLAEAQADREEWD